MQLTSTERAVVQTASGADIPESGESHIDEWRTFCDLDRDRLMGLVENHADYLRNEDVPRLPTVERISAFLDDYPFFRVHGFFHNLTVPEPVEMYITGIEYVPCTGMSIASFDEASLVEMKRRFTSLFYGADYLHIEDTELVAEYYFERLLETIES